MFHREWGGLSQVCRSCRSTYLPETLHSPHKVSRDTITNVNNVEDHVTWFPGADVIQHAQDGISGRGGHGSHVGIATVRVLIVHKTVGCDLDLLVP